MKDRNQGDIVFHPMGQLFHPMEQSVPSYGTKRSTLWNKQGGAAFTSF